MTRDDVMHITPLLDRREAADVVDGLCVGAAQAIRWWPDHTAGSVNAAVRTTSPCRKSRNSR